MIFEPQSLDEGRHIGQKSIHSVCVDVEDVFNSILEWRPIYLWIMAEFEFAWQDLLYLADHLE